MNEDAHLLRRYAEENSEPAFGELVRRHVDFVYHVALRRVGGDSHLAQDVTQQVFTALARQARELVRHPVLNGWLYTTTRNIAAQTVRGESRRRGREQEAITMNELDLAGAPQPEWERLRPELDDALDQLGAGDRLAVLLRFFEGCSFAEVGTRLQLTENAARMRVDRALDKMHATLSRRGLGSTAAALGAALAAQAGGAAPAGLAATVTGAALAGATASAGVGGLLFMSMTKLQWGIVATLIVAGVGSFVVQRQTNEDLRGQVADLRQRGVEMTRLRAENDRLRAEAARLVPPRNEIAAPERTAEPVAVPRAEIARGNARSAKVALAPGLVSIDSLEHTGRATPRAAWSTQLWAAAEGEVELEAASITFDPAARAKLEALLASLPEAARAAYGTPERLMASVLAGSPHPVGGMRVLGEIAQGSNEVVLQTEWQHADDAIVHQSEVKIRQDETGWKMVVPMALVDRAAAYLTRTAGTPPGGR